jgi:hypothetical protein
MSRDIYPARSLGLKDLYGKYYGIKDLASVPPPGLSQRDGTNKRVREDSAPYSYSGSIVSIRSIHPDNFGEIISATASVTCVENRQERGLTEFSKIAKTGTDESLKHEHILNDLRHN